MRRIRSLGFHEGEKLDVFYSPEAEREMGEEGGLLRTVGWEMLGRMFVVRILDNEEPNEEELKKLIEINARKFRLPDKKAILFAHGGSSFGRWVYECRGRALYVQNWINSVDGDYSALILNVCNPGHHEITSKESAVLAPNNNLAEFLRGTGAFQTELYLPEIGYLSSYEIKSVLKEEESR